MKKPPFDMSVKDGPDRVWVVLLWEKHKTKDGGFWRLMGAFGKYAKARAYWKKLGGGRKDGVDMLAIPFKP